MPDHPVHPDFEIMVGRYLNGSLCDEDAQNFIESLKNSPKLTEIFWQQLRTAAQLSDLEKGCGESPSAISLLTELKLFELQQAPVNPESKNRPPQVYPREGRATRFTLLYRLSFLLIVAGVGLSAFFIGLGSYLFTTKTPEPQIAVSNPQGENPQGANQGEKQSNAVAVVRIMSEVVWGENENQNIRPGQILGAGWIKTSSGLIVIDFFSGASVILEGPALFEIISPSLAYCSKGRIIAEVPPQASGFRINVPQMEVVDIGTPFSIDVSAKETLVHVLEGEVELHSLATGVELLKIGDAASVDDSGSLNRMAAPPDSLVSIERLKAATRKERFERYVKWKQQAEKLNSDPSLLVRFDFDNHQSGTRYINNTSETGGKATPNGLMIDSRLVEGRWEDKKAIEFKRIADRVRFYIPDEMESVSLATWVRVDGLDRRYNALLTTDGFNPGEVHWHIRHHGTIELGINFSEHEECLQVQTPVIVTPERMGEWLHLAAVIDTPNGIVNMYVNGELVHSELFHMPIPIRFKSLQLGNWTIGAGL